MFKLNCTISFIFSLITILSIAQGPNATFNVSALEICAGESITFTSTSSPGTSNSTITKEKWDFGDGSTSGDLPGSQNSISHTYNNAGTYFISFFVTDENNITTSNPTSGDSPLQIKVNEIPVVDFISNIGSCSLPVNVTFTNNSSNIGNYSYSWNFDNGTTSNFFDPGIISFSVAKNYDISLAVLDTLTGCFNSKNEQITINNFNADFELSSDTICQNSSVILTDLSTSGVNEWLWDNGNGETKTSQNPSFVYNSEGTFTISLTAFNSSTNCTDILTKELVVLPLPLIDISATPQKGCSPLSVDFINNNINPSVDYTWDFGDGSSNYLGDVPPTHDYTTDGFFTVSLNATSNYGCQSDEIYSNLIEVAPAIADFNSDIVNGCEPINVQFNDLSESTDSSSDPIISWNWDFGNGNTSTLENPNIETYNVGKYDISLSITTQKGCNASISKSEYIQVGEIDSVGFSLDTDTICAKSSVQFTDLSLISITHNPSEVIYAWDFGDGGSDGSKDPIWSYPSDTGNFDVNLIVDIRGCKDSFKIDSAVFVWPPIANFTPEQFSYCNPASFPVQVDVNDQAIIGRNGDDVDMIYRWGDSGNNTTNFTSTNFDSDNDQWSSSFNYNNYGTYDIKQVVYNNTSGCSDSITQTIAISAVSSGLSLSSDSICQFSNIDISDLSTSVLGNIVAVEYDTGDSIIIGNVGTVTSYIYNTSNSYNIQITATDEFGCQSSSTDNITVLALPVADILPSKIGACALENITYQNMSGFSGTTHASNISISNWIKPDLTSETTNDLSESINYIVPDIGEFKTYLTVIDNFGCTSFPDSVSVFVTIPSPKYNNPTTICNNSSFTILNNSNGEGNLSSEWSIDNSLVSNSNDLNYTFNESYNGNQYSNHKLTLVVTDVNGCKDSLSKNLLLSIPNADFIPTATGVNQSAAFSFSCPPVYVNFANNSTTPNSSLWNFGNGNTSSQENPEATYIQPGLYTVSLSITNSDGCMDDTTLIDYLSIGGPKATPYVFNQGVFCKNNFVFYVTDTAQIDQLIWDFDDNSTSSIDSIVHNYPVGGSYFPTLMISDSYNCSIIFNLDTINVIDELISEFTVSKNPAKTNEEIIFTDLSTSITPIVEWTWELNDFDGEVIILDTSSSLVKAYEYPFTYYTVLTVTDLNGCTSSDTIPVKITGDFEVPNVFTPNFDNVNDVFVFNQDIFDHYNVLIFNRWGNVVFEKQNVTGTAIWNGMDNNNKKCTDGVYFFQIKGFLKDLTPFEKNGYVTKITGY